MKTQNKSKKSVGAVVAIICALAIVLTGTWAWRDIDQMAANEFKATNYEAELVDIFTPPTDWEPGQEINKDVSVKNTGNGDIFVRVNFKEIFDYMGSSTAETLHKPGEWDADPMDCTCEAHDMISWLMGDGVIKDISEFEGVEDAWFYDAATGWFYWGNPLSAGEETAKILDSVTLNADAEVEDDLKYIINVYMHAFSANQAGYDDFVAQAGTDGETISSDTSDLVHTILGWTKIDNASFPDDTFRQYVEENIDTNKDGQLSLEEIDKVTEISIIGDIEYGGAEDLTIEEMTGIENFTKIEVLEIVFCELSTTPDVSKMTELRTLDLGANQLTVAPDLSNNTKLEIVSFMRNELTVAPDVSNCPALVVYNIGENQISVLPNLSNNLQLEEYYCFDNLLTGTLDMAANVNLKTLYCFGNLFTGTLDMTANVNLETLGCGANQLSLIDVTGCTKLTSFVATENDPSLVIVGWNG